MTQEADGSHFGPKHLKQIILSYSHFIENHQAKLGQHYIEIYGGLQILAMSMAKIGVCWWVVNTVPMVTDFNFFLNFKKLSIFGGDFHFETKWQDPDALDIFPERHCPFGHVNEGRKDAPCIEWQPDILLT